jgi:hypothetical protein
MKALTFALLLILVLLLVACGGMGYGGMTNATPNASSNMNGNWTTTMMNPSGAQMMVFTSALNQGSGNVVTATNLQFMMGTACFPMGASGTGAVMSNSNMNGSTMMSFGMTIQSTGAQSGSMDMMGMTTTGTSVLTLQGSMTNMNTVSGTWTMSGVTSGCIGSGNFTMTKM